MSGNSVTLKYLLQGDDNISPAMKKAGRETGSAGQMLSKFGSVTKAAVTDAASAVVAFGSSSVDKFKQVAGEARGVQRALGGTVEEASRMRFAANQSGVDTETFTKSMQKLDKTLVGATGNQKSIAAMTARMGVAFTDANGKVKPMNELLPQLADHFKSMPDGADKTALALQLFGKAGTGMLPFLGKGSEGIKKLTDESDKFGQTLSEKNIDALGDSKKSTREWNAALDGVKIQLGSFLLPVMTGFVNILRQAVIPLVQSVIAWMQKHRKGIEQLGQGLIALAKGVYEKLVAPVIKALIPVIRSIMEWIEKHKEGLKQLGAVLAGIVVTAVKVVIAIVKALIVGIKGAWDGIKAAAAGIAAAWYAVSNAVMWVWDHVISPVYNGIKVGIGVVKTVVGAYITAIVAVWSGLATAVMWVWSNVISPVYGWIKTGISAVRTVVGAVGSAISTAFRGVGDGLRWVWDHVFHPIYTGIKAGVQGVSDFITPIISAVSTAFRTIGDGLKWAWDHTVGPVFGAIKGAIQDILDAYNSLFSTKALIHDVGGSKLDKAIEQGKAKTGGHAQGAGFFRGGITRWNENGDEMITLPNGSRITPHSSMVSQMGVGGPAIGHVTINVPDSAPDPLAYGRRLASELETFVNNGGSVKIAQGVR